MNTVYKAISIVILAMVLGCSKADEEKPSENVFIRVKNTSVLNFLNVRIYPSEEGNQMKESGLVESGQLTGYLEFKKAYNPVGIEVKLTENRTIGLLPLINNDTKLLVK